MSIIRIDEADDPRLADYVGLTDVALRSRREPEEGLFIAESTSVIERALEAGHRPRSFLMEEKWLEPLLPLLESVDAGPRGSVQTFVARKAVLESITGFNVHRGALAAMHRPHLLAVTELLADPSLRLVVILEDIVDHTNVGAIFRSVAALGADAVLVTPRCADPLYRRSVRVSMGTVFQIPWTRMPAWPQGVQDLRDAGFTLAALALTERSVALDDFYPEGRVALVLGTEGDGISERGLAAADVHVRIPMAGGVDSLNVAAASAVAIWALRDRHDQAKRVTMRAMAAKPMAT
jgi:tRNA G18 (ribose-2'-O)-methylase SpoU